MNLKRMVATAAATLALGFGSQASAAVTYLGDGQGGACNIYDTAAGGCLFSVNPANDANDIDLIVAEYNDNVDPDLATGDFNFLGKADPDGGTVDYDDNGNSWTFTDLASPVNFFVVKQASYVILFGFTVPQTSFTATNTLLPNNPGISHVNLYYSDGNNTPGAIPEPATWAMMIMGFGASGVMIRRRRYSMTVA